MKIVETEVNSNKVLLGKVNVEEFETIQEAADFFQKEAGKDASESAGASEILKMVNAQYKANVTNAFRVANTRTEKPMTALRNKIKTGDAATKMKIAAFLESLGLPSNLDE
jgi:hypothetical protein